MLLFVAIIPVNKSTPVLKIDFNRDYLSNRTMLDMYRDMQFARMVEEKMLVLLRQGKISKWFSGIGQEAISVGLTHALTSDDYILPLHRNLGVFLSRKIDLTKLISQWIGKKTGFTKGRDRSFHFGSPEDRIIGMISHLGAMLPVADGLALASNLDKKPFIAVPFIGDGGTSEGDVHEAMNVAAVWDLPVLFLIENNGYGLSTPIQEQFRCTHLADRAQGYGMAGLTIDGNNVLEVYHAVFEIVRQMRIDRKPAFLECQTFRMRGHEEASGIKYIPQELFDQWKQKDPLWNFEQYLMKEGVLKEEEIGKIKEELKEIIGNAVEDAWKEEEVIPDKSEELNAVYSSRKFVPTTKVGVELIERERLEEESDHTVINGHQDHLVEEEIIQQAPTGHNMPEMESKDQISNKSIGISNPSHSFSEFVGNRGIGESANFSLASSSEVSSECVSDGPIVSEQAISVYKNGHHKQQMRFVDAIRDGLDVAMDLYKNLVLMGQDIATYGGVFKVTEGLLEKYGKERVRNTPLCESAILGMGLGLAIEGKKSMIEMQFADFVACGFNQIVNNLAKTHYRWGQEADVVIRMPTGGGVGAGPFHSQSIESWFTHVPGLKVVYPAFPEDAKGLLLSSFADPNPILFFEHKYLYRKIEGNVSEGYFDVPLQNARIVQEGESLSIITYGLGVHWALAHAKAFPEGEIEIVDLRTLVPWDRDTVFQSVKKTGKCLVLYEASYTSAFGAEIAASVSEYCFEYLDGPVKRIGSLDTPVPFHPELEASYLASHKLAQEIEELLSF